MRPDLCSLSLLALLAMPNLLPAEESETRVFRVRVADRDAGTVTMVMLHQADGSVRCDTTVDIKARVLIKTYEYALRTAEVWKDGRMLSLSSQANDDGKRYTVQAVPTESGMRIVVNDKTSETRVPLGSDNFWKVPEAAAKNPLIPVIRADLGTVVSAKFEKLGVEKVLIGRQEIRCTHYRFNAEPKVDLWFDGADRLVRQESVELGQRTIVELIRRDLTKTP
jgi:Family of unknown function (DUF6134)